MPDRKLDGLFRRALDRDVAWAPARLQGDYAVVDGARNPQIFPALMSSRAESTCLYDGVLSRGLARVAPYLVRLERGSRFARVFYEEGWNDAWGVVVRTTVGLQILRRHFRTLAYARHGSGPKLLFRYYDVRVLRVFLPTCDARQLAQVFGPVDAFVLDGTGGVDPQIVSRDADGGLQIQNVHLRDEKAS